MWPVYSVPTGACLTCADRVVAHHVGADRWAAACSPIITQLRWVFARSTLGMINASATRRPTRPGTRVGTRRACLRDDVVIRGHWPPLPPQLITRRLLHSGGHCLVARAARCNKVEIPRARCAMLHSPSCTGPTRHRDRQRSTVRDRSPMAPGAPARPADPHQGAYREQHREGLAAQAPPHRPGLA